MADITVTVAICLAAFSASLMLAKREAIEIARNYSYCAMIIFGVHAFGVAITAPVASGPAETIAIIGFAWLVIATLGLAIRGGLRIVADRRARA